MARYTLPSLLQGHPPSQSSGTLMSLQEGIAVLRARMGLQQALSRLALGRRTDVPTEPPPYPATNLRLPASCLRYLTPVFPLPVPAHSSQTEAPRFVPQRTVAPTTPPARRGEERQGRGRYVPSRHQGVRREARTGSLQEQGTYRLDPSNRAQPPHPIQNKTPLPNW